MENDKQIRYLTNADASEVTEIPVATMKRYMQNHADYVDYKKVNREYRVRESSLEVLKYIRSLYESGKRQDEVNECLVNSHFDKFIFVDEEKEESSLVILNNEVKSLKDMLKEQGEYMKVQSEYLKAQNEQIQELKQAIEDRDNRLYEYLERLENKVDEPAIELEEKTEEVEEVPEIKEVTKEKKGNWFTKIFKK